MADDRLTYCLPVDVTRQFDSTVTQAQLSNSTFQNSPDDNDLLAGMIEDAEAEFNNATDDQLKIGRQGQQGNRNTYEQPSYKVSGHKLTKGTFTGVWSDYLPQEKVIMLDKQGIIPFDETAGDEVYIYRGLSGDGSRWENVTDERGDMWDILDNVSGKFVFSPVETAEYLLDLHTGTLARGVPSFLRRIRFAVSYRYGGLGGSRSRPTRTELAESLTDTQTGTVNVADGDNFPTGGSSGSVNVLINREYLRVDPDPANDSMEIIERGVRGTAAESHANGDRVQHTPPAVTKAVSARAAMQLVRSGRYSEWLPDTEDSLDKSDVISELEATWETTVDALS